MDTLENFEKKRENSFVFHCHVCNPQKLSPDKNSEHREHKSGPLFLVRLNDTHHDGAGAPLALMLS